MTTHAFFDPFGACAAGEPHAEPAAGSSHQAAPSSAV
jgi:hypothetical protein